LSSHLIQSRSTRKLRLGVVGAGFGQAVHVPAFRASPPCEIGAICASTVEKARAAAETLNIPGAHGRWQDLVADADVDAVAIALPPALQAEAALTALEMGKPVFAEKPLADSLNSARRLWEVAAQVGVANMVDFEFLDIPAWQLASQLLAAGGLGRLRHIVVNWQVETYAQRAGIRNWKTSMVDGGALNLLVSHCFYYIEHMAGPIKAVSARLSRTPGDARTGDALDVLVLDLESGATAMLCVSVHSFAGSGHRVEFYGDDGTMVLDNPTADYVHGFTLRYGTRKEGGLTEVTVPAAREDVWPRDGRIYVVARLAARFVSWALGGSAARPSFRDGMRVQRLLDAARRSDASGSRVGVPGDA
jgi:predicted dehydrogenase